MASVGSVSSGSSLYGTRNVFTGLASGLDTESMIENMVSGTKAKITSLQQKQTIWQWKQEAYRNVLDLMIDFSDKYTSYNSNKNLFSANFFNNAVTTTTNGANAAKVSATGKTSSDISINRVLQMAQKATYRVSAKDTDLNKGGDVPTISGKEIDLSEEMDVSRVSGSLTFTYGNKKVSIDLGEVGEDVVNSPDELAALISKKLKDQTITTSKGEMKAADTLIDVNVVDGKIQFSDKSNAGNSVYISGATGKIAENLDLKDKVGKELTSLTLADDFTYTEQVHTGEYLAGKEFTITLDGKQKRFEMPEYTEGMTGDEYAQKLQEQLDGAFGKGKITVGNTASDGKLALEFTTQKGSTMTFSSKVGEAMGLSQREYSYLDTGKRLGDLLSKDVLDTMEHKAAKVVGGNGAVVEKDGKYYDAAGNEVKKREDSTGEYYRVDKNGEELFEYELKINGKVIGTYTQDTALESVMLDINNNTEVGVKLSFSKTTNQFQFTTEESGGSQGIKIEEGGLAAALFGATVDSTGAINAKQGSYSAGTDAIFEMTVNGETYTTTRSDNTFDVDGLSITLKGAFGYTTNADGKPVNEKGEVVDLENVPSTGLEGALANSKAETEAVTFTSTSDADKIVDAIKEMINDYNEMMGKIKDQYGTLPAQRSNGKGYEPLTDEDREGMSESAIKAHEEKAKQGLLFGDSDLSALYNKMLSAFTPAGNDGGYLRSIGITSEYSISTGDFTIKLDEKKLRTALSNNPDAVKDAFTKSVENGAATDGVMQTMKTQLDRYAKYLGEPKGILVNKAGTNKSSMSLMNNYIQKSIDSINDEIARWETKLNDQIDRYTGQFSRLEMLIQQMNSQSASLAGMMGMG